MKEVVALLSFVEFDAGQIVFREGSAGDSFYILLHGRVQVTRGGATLACLDARDADVVTGQPFFGEMALLDGQPRMAAVSTLTPCQLLILRWDHFPLFLDLVPNFKQRIRRVKALRKSAASSGIQKVVQ